MARSPHVRQVGAHYRDERIAATLGFRQDILGDELLNATRREIQNLGNVETGTMRAASAAALGSDFVCISVDPRTFALKFNSNSEAKRSEKLCTCAEAELARTLDLGVPWKDPGKRA